MKNVQVRLKHPPKTAPTPEDFELVECEAPTVGAGQILCRARWLALDPHVALPVNGRPYPGAAGDGLVPSRAVAEVIESRNDVFDVGAFVELEHGLQELSVSDGSTAHAVRPAQSPLSTALGVLGLPGMIAYFGLIDVARIARGETVLVVSAAGAIGAMAGQIAKLRGARAIGVANAREKCDWVTRTARFAACINERAEDVGQRLRALAPQGVDIVFDDGVDGSIAELVARGGHLAAGGRIVRRAGAAATGAQAADTRIIDLAAFAQRREEFLKQAGAWHGEGLIVYREDIVEGLPNAPAHLCRLMRGENFGKPLVRI